MSLQKKNKSFSYKNKQKICLYRKNFELYLKIHQLSDCNSKTREVKYFLYILERNNVLKFR